MAVTRTCVNCHNDYDAINCPQCYIPEKAKTEQITAEQIDPGVLMKAKSSETVRHRYISHLALKALTEHLCNGSDGNGGAERYGKDNWKKGQKDSEFWKDRIEHMIEHSYALLEMVNGESKSADLMDEHIRGIGSNWMFIQHFIEEIKNAR